MITKNDFSKVVDSNYVLISNETIEAQENAVKNDKIYNNDAFILKEFLNKYPNNTNVDTIIQKIRLIDFTNSTNLRMHKDTISIPQLAEIIANIDNFDERVETGDCQIVDEIAQCSKVNLFSFASKYCCYHNVLIYNNDHYAIYDDVVKKTLPHYINVTQSYINSCRTNYEKFNDIITKVLELYQINIDSKRRKLDHFLWYKNK